MTNEEYLEIKDKLEKQGRVLADMLEWSRHWLETAPLMGDKTKTLLLNFCKEYGVEVNLPKKKT